MDAYPSSVASNGLRQLPIDDLHDPLPSLRFTMPVAIRAPAPPAGLKSYYQAKIEAAEIEINQKTQNLRRLEAQRNALNARGSSTHHSWITVCGSRASSVRLLREELQLLHEPGSYVGEVVKVMGKNKVLVKVQPEGKYSAPFRILL